MADENTNYPEEKRSLRDDAVDYDPELDDSKVKFLNGEKRGLVDECVVEVNGSQGSDVSFTGLGKEELMKFADDPFWVWTRRILVAIFGIGWLLMLVAAIIIIVLAPRCPERPDLKWYQTDVTYQINPKSFKDTTKEAGEEGAGIGDLAGIHQKIGYFEGLGVNSLWINSIYKSGGLYDGNDVEDHTQVDPVFGTMEHFKQLRKDTKKKGMRISLDFIPNHTGKKHDWFVKSQAKDPEYADFYIWADGKDSSTPPNNWVTEYNEPAWKYDTTRKQWYYFSYLPEYPDLNLRNEEVLQKLDGILRFWLDLGVDGLAVQGLQRLIEANDTSKQEASTGEFTVDQPENLALVARWRAIIDSYSNKPGRERALFAHVTASGNNTDYYYSAGIHVIISDALIGIDPDQCDANCMKMKLDEATEGKKWRGWMLDNENTARFSSVLQGKLLQAFQALHLLMPGSTFMYYGDEIGMVNGLVNYTAMKDPLAKMGKESRDPYRTPMLWNSDENAGFSAEGITPWLPVSSNYKQASVAYNFAHMVPSSPLKTFKGLMELRSKESFLWGETKLGVEHGDLLYITREAKGFPGYMIVVNRGVNTAAFAGKADSMKLVYDSEDSSRVGQTFNTKSTDLAFQKDGEVYIFEYMTKSDS